MSQLVCDNKNRQVWREVSVEALVIAFKFCKDHLISSSVRPGAAGIFFQSAEKQTQNLQMTIKLEVYFVLSEENSNNSM